MVPHLKYKYQYKIVSKFITNNLRDTSHHKEKIISIIGFELKYQFNTLEWNKS
ncbi:hypothetical protein NBRC116600_00960 [Thalassotalea sp. SU-HH00458]